MKKTQWPIRWDLLLRYRLIEIIALWEGRLTTNHICHAFGIGRQQASKDINTYLREIGPGNLEYDRHLKGYVPTEAFTPKVTRGEPREYLQHLSRDIELQRTFESLDVGLPNTDVVSAPGFGGRPEMLRPLMLAARQRRKLEVTTVSLSNPSPEDDVIEPHTLVCGSHGWHARAWSEREGGYTDIRVSRLRGEPRILAQRSRNRADRDEAWQTRVDVELSPADHLSPAQQAIVAEDYGMTDGRLAIDTRGPLVPYLMSCLPLARPHRTPLDSQNCLKLANADNLKAWMS